MSIKIDALIEQYGNIDKGTVLTQADIPAGTISNKADKIIANYSGVLSTIHVTEIPGAINFDISQSIASGGIEEEIQFVNGSFLKIFADNSLRLVSLDGSEQVLFDGTQWLGASTSVRFAVANLVPNPLTNPFWSTAAYSYQQEDNLDDIQYRLDQVSQVAIDAYLSAHSSVPRTDVVNDLITGGATKALSAEMGRVLHSTKIAKDFIHDKILAGSYGLVYNVDLVREVSDSNSWHIGASYRDPETNIDTDFFKPVPLASSAQAGFMPKEAYELLDVLNVDVASLKANAFTPIGTLSIDNASFSGLDDAGKTQAVVSEFPSWAGNFRNNLAIKTSDNVTYVVSGGTAFDPDWVIWGDVGVTVATNSSLGIVKGTASTPGKIFVESDGSLSLNGFDAIADAIVDLGNNKLNTSAVNSAVFNAQGILADSPPSNTLPGSGITLSIQSILDTMLGNLKALFDGFNNGVANSATKLATARYINLDSTSTTSSALFDGTQDITIGVPVPSLTDAGASSTLPVVGSVVSLRTFSQGVRNNLKELFSYFDSSGSANSAIKLKNGRRLTVNLGSQTSTPATFDGTANVSIGVEGVLKRISGGLENEIGATYFDGVKQFSSSADLAAFLLTIPPNSHYSFLISFSSVILGGVNAPSAGLWLYDFYQQDNTLANSFSELRWAGGSSNVGYIGLCQRLSYSKRGDPTTDAVKWARDIPIRVVPTRVKQWGKLFSQTEYVLTVPNNTNASQPVFVEFDAIINNNTTIGGSANTRVYISSLGRAFQYMTSITTHNIYLGVQGFTGYYIRIAVTHPSDWEYHFIPNAYYFNGSNIDWKTINTPIDMYIGYDKEPFDGTVAD